MDLYERNMGKSKMRIPLLVTIAGSRAYHMERDNSDWDYHCVYITSTVELLKLGPTPKQTLWEENVRGDDTQGWELGHFLHLATKCNPTILETFVAPVVEEQSLFPEATELQDLFPHVLSRKRVFDAFRGYAHNQRTKLFNKPDDPTNNQPTERIWKFATQYLRVLLIGERLLRTGKMVIDMQDWVSGYSYLCAVRDGKKTIGEVVDEAKRLEMKMEQMYNFSEIPEEADLDKVNEYLIRMRRRYW